MYLFVCSFFNFILLSKENNKKKTYFSNKSQVKKCKLHFHHESAKLTFKFENDFLFPFYFVAYF